MTSGIYGLKTAARVYFNKKVSELTEAEQIFLAGLPQKPVAYNPLRWQKIDEKGLTEFAEIQDNGRKARLYN